MTELTKSSKTPVYRVYLPQRRDGREYLTRRCAHPPRVWPPMLTYFVLVVAFDTAVKTAWIHLLNTAVLSIVVIGGRHMLWRYRHPRVSDQKMVEDWMKHQRQNASWN